MKLGTFRTAAVAAASLLSVAVAAQTGTGPGLDIPEGARAIGKQEPNVRKATAIVNGDVITGTDIDHRIALILASNDVELPPEEIERVRAQVLRNLIDETLQIQAATQADITIQQSDIDAYYARIAANFGHTPESFDDFLRSIGASERSLKRQVHGELAWSRLQRERIQPFVNVGDEEVQESIDRLKESRGTKEYRVAEIFISATPETAVEARNNAARIVQQIRNGASFPAYARQFSEASTAAIGGDLGWVRVEQLPAELAAPVRQMPVGAVTDPIAVPGGFSIVMLTDDRQILTADPRNASLSLVQMSLNLPAGTGEQEAERRGTQLAQLAQNMGGCGRANEAGQTIGAQVTSRDQVPVRDLPPILQQWLLEMDIGQATPAFGSSEQVSVLVLCGRDDPEEVGEPSFDDIYARMSQERVNRRAQRYLRDLRRDAVIEYR